MSRSPQSRVSWIWTVRSFRGVQYAAAVLFHSTFTFSARLAVQPCFHWSPEMMSWKGKLELEWLRVDKSSLAALWPHHVDVPALETQKLCPMSVQVIRRCIVLTSSDCVYASSFMNESLMKRSWTLEDKNSLSSKQHWGAALSQACGRSC